MEIPSRKEMQQAWIEVRENHEKYLSKPGVKIPSNFRFDESKKYLAGISAPE